MTRNPRRQAAEAERECEALLRIAADYTPETEMPFGLETRALSDVKSRRRSASDTLRLVGVGGALIFGLFQFFAATTHRTLPPAYPGSEGNPVAVAHQPINPTPIPGASHPKIGTRKPQTLAAKSDLKFIRTRRDRHTIRVAIARPRHRTTRVHTGRRLVVVHADRSPTLSASASASAGKSSVWRTEIVSTQTVGYLTPVWIAVTDSEHNSVLVSPALLGVPYQARQSLCSGEDTSDEAGSQN